MSNKRKLMEDPEEEMDQPEEGCRSEQRQSRQPNLTTRPTTGHSEPVTGEQLSCTQPNPTTPQQTHRTGPTFNVEVTLTVGPPTEEVRREIKGFLALRIAELPLTTTSVPVRIVGGAHSPCLRRRGYKGSKGVVTELLGAGMTLQSELDLFCDVTGSEDLTNLTGRQIVQFLQRQNLDLPPDSLIFVSMNSAGGRSPTACMWMSRLAIPTSVGMATNSGQR